MIRFIGEQLSTVRAGFRRLFDVVASHRGLRLAIRTLLAIDLLFILYFGVGKLQLELGRDETLYDHKELLITTDGGIPEWINYLQLAVIVMLLVRLARSTRQPIYGSLAFTYLAVVLDDALQIHDEGGAYLKVWAHLQPWHGLRSQDVAELIIWSLLGALIVPLLAWGYVRSSEKHRGNGLVLLAAFGLLLFCALFIDQLYNNFRDVFTGAGVLLDILEDGGEMIAVTLTLALALALAEENRQETAAEPPA